MLDLEKAEQKLEGKSYAQIQEETAWSWASMACVNFQKCLSAEGPKRLVYWTIGEEYRTEAIEHAGTAEKDTDFCKEIRKAVSPYQEKAATLIDSMVNGTNKENPNGQEK